MNKLLCEVLSMCFRISRESDADVFFEYIPHCDSYSIYWYRDGWTQETAADFVWLNCVTGISPRNLRKSLAMLNGIAAEMEVA